MTAPMVEVSVGDTIIQVDKYGRTVARTATVTKVARIWIETSTGARFRRDTQTDGSDHSLSLRFYTVEQWATLKRDAEARQFLRDEGIQIAAFGPQKWTPLALANLIREARKS
jgi:hypothetical protein